MWEKVRVFLWRLIFMPYYRFLYYKTKQERKRLCILNSLETVLYIVNNKCSVARYGDGEFQMIGHYLNSKSQEEFQIDTFQEYDSLLAQKLLYVFRNEVHNLLVCVPYSYKDSTVYKGYGRTFYERDWLLRKTLLLGEKNKLFGDSCFTRFFLERTDIEFLNYISLLKLIWDKRRLLIVEGKQSRLGVGNDLFDNAVSIQRILCPAINAFSKYDEILSEIKKYSKEYLCLLALGHTATVLTFDLSVLGYQAIDIGHVDVEYEWFRMGAIKKVAVPNKYVNEVKEGRISTELSDRTYEEQIISIID